jgi:hypothetical protein
MHSKVGVELLEKVLDKVDRQMMDFMLRGKEVKEDD